MLGKLLGFISLGTQSNELKLNNKLGNALSAIE